MANGCNVRMFQDWVYDAREQVCPPALPSRRANQVLANFNLGVRQPLRQTVCLHTVAVCNSRIRLIDAHNEAGHSPQSRNQQFAQARITTEHHATMPRSRLRMITMHERRGKAMHGEHDGHDGSFLDARNFNIDCVMIRPVKRFGAGSALLECQMRITRNGDPIACGGDGPHIAQRSIAVNHEA